MLKPLVLAATAFAAVCPLAAAQDDADTAYLFTSFRGDGDGLHLSYSDDALHWTPLSGTFLKPQVGDRLMRDPDLLRGPDGTYHLVWTTGWGDGGIGYASSTNLTDWPKQSFIPLLENANQHWAPELFYDEPNERFLIVWSSSMRDGKSFRAYYVTTEDFETFSEPALLFDPPIDNIDTTMRKTGDRYTIVFKQTDDQGNGVWGDIYAATADSPTGPYTLVETPLLDDQRAEGPALAQVGDRTLLYVDYYTQGRFGVLSTTDWQTWTDMSDEAEIVEGQRHGSIVEVPSELVENLVMAEQDKLAGVPEPILDGFRADPSIRVFGDKYYVYPTSDKPNWATTDFSVWSSPDLVNWTDEGMILDVTSELSWADLRAWAPDALEGPDGKFYFYFCADAKIGVGVADSPTGPFVDALDRPFIEKGGLGGKVDVGQAIDPAGFVDDDGTRYLYYGNGGCQVVKLGDDMVSVEGDPVDIELRDFREGIWVFKRNGKYYFMWSIDDARSPDYRVGWGVSDSPLGPVVSPENEEDFIVLRQNGPAVGTAHHSVVNVPGTDRWYACYHRHAIPDGSGFKRQVCLTPMTFDSDGNIEKMDPMIPAFPEGSPGEPLINGQGDPQPPEAR